MVRYGNAFPIFYSELNKGLVKIHNYKDYTEYWIHRYLPSSVIGPSGNPLLSDETYLWGIVVCLPNHIKDKNDKEFLVEGVRFTNDEKGQDIETYLNKTNRGHNG